MNMLMTTGQPSQAELEFQEKMRSRLRQAMGDLLPDEVLAKVVERGIEEAFFTGRKINAGSWNEKVELPWVVMFLENECRKQVAVAVQQWCVDHTARIEGILKGVLERGLAAVVVTAFNDILADNLNALRDGVMESIRNLGNR